MQKKKTTAKNPHNPPQHLETKRSKTPFICFYVCCRGNIAALQYPQRWAAPVINWHGLSVNPGADPPSLQSSRTSRGGQTKWRSRRPRRVIPGGGAGAVCKAPRGSEDALAGAELSGRSVCALKPNRDVRGKPMNTCPPAYRGAINRRQLLAGPVRWFVCQEVTVVGVCVVVVSSSQCTIP